MNTARSKPFKIKDVTRVVRKAIVAATLVEMKLKVAERFGKPESVPKIHYDACGTEIDDEEYFATLKPNAELIAVFPGERWIDATHYVTITSRRHSNDETDHAAVEIERVRMDKLVTQLRSNLCNVTVLSDTDLEVLANMDPDSVSDLGGKEFVTQLKEIAGRLLREKKTADKAVELLRLVAKHHEVLIDLLPIQRPSTAHSSQQHPQLDTSASSDSTTSSEPTSTLSVETPPDQSN